MQNTRKQFSLRRVSKNATALTSGTAQDVRSLNTRDSRFGNVDPQQAESLEFMQPQARSNSMIKTRPPKAAQYLSGVIHTSHSRNDATSPTLPKKRASVLSNT